MDLRKQLSMWTHRLRRWVAHRLPADSDLRRSVERWILEPLLDQLARLRLRWRHLTRWRDSCSPLGDSAARMGRSGGDRLGSPLCDPEGRRRPRILFALHDAAGGVRETTEDLLQRLHSAYECYLLSAKPIRLKLHRYDPAGLEPLETWWLQERWSHRREHSEEHRAAYRSALEGLAIDLIHVRHLLGHTGDLLEVASGLRIPIVLSFHDFYMACPTVHLLDDEGRYCAGHCTPSLGQCRLPIAWLEDLPVLKGGYLEEWRARVRRLLPHISAFVTTSKTARDVFLDIFPELARKDFRIIEHGRDFLEQRRLAHTPRLDEPVRIVVPGHLRFHKGSEFIRRLSELDRSGERRLEFHLLGTTDQRLEEVGINHGPYRRDELADRVRHIRPSFFGIFSVWPETYSHTLTEAWSLGVPVLGSELGAVGERLAIHGGGWTLPVRDEERSYEKIMEIVRCPESYRREEARARLENVRTVQHMTSDYDALYRSLLAVETAVPTGDATRP